MAKVALPPNFDRDVFGMEKIGTYHLHVISVDEYPQKHKTGEPIPGWRVSCCVLAGTENCEKGKEIELTLRHPSPNHADGGDFCQRVQARFLLATGLVQEDEAGKEVDVDLEKAAVGRQFIAKFSVQKKTPQYPDERIDLDGASLWHVDDGSVAWVPKDAAHLKLIPQELRMISGKGPSKPETTTETSPVNPTAYSEPVNPGKTKYYSL